MFSTIHMEFQMLQKFQFMQLQKQLSEENVNLNTLNKYKSQPELGLEEGNSFPIDTMLYCTFPKRSSLNSNAGWNLAYFPIESQDH